MVCLANAQEAAFGLTLWLVVIVVVVLTATVVLLYFRRRVRGTPSQAYPGFTFDDIREMRRRGALSDDEYQALRRQVLGLSGSADSGEDG